MDLADVCGRQQQRGEQGLGGDAAGAARYLEIPLAFVQAAITYYGAYQDEIDQWIEANEEEAAEASAAWSAGQAAVKQ